MASMTGKEHQRSAQRFIPQDAHAAANIFSRGFAIIAAARRRKRRRDLARAIHVLSRNLHLTITRHTPLAASCDEMIK